MRLFDNRASVITKQGRIIRNFYFEYSNGARSTFFKVYVWVIPIVFKLSGDLCAFTFENVRTREIENTCHHMAVNFREIKMVIRSGLTRSHVSSIKSIH